MTADQIARILGVTRSMAEQARQCAPRKYRGYTSAQLDERAAKFDALSRQ